MQESLPNSVPLEEQSTDVDVVQDCSLKEKDDEKMKNILFKIFTREYSLKNLCRLKSTKWFAIAYFVVSMIYLFLLKIAQKAKECLKKRLKSFKKRILLILNFKDAEFVCNQEKFISFYAFLIGERKFAPNNNEL